jgi:hypothetical protein
LHRPENVRSKSVCDVSISWYTREMN